MVYYRKIILNLLLLTVIVSCSTEPDGTKGDDFYSRTGGWDTYRIPLIKPYQLTSNDKFVWFLNLRNPKMIIKKDVIDGVDSVGIYDNIIIAYCNLTSVSNEMTEAWFIIDINKAEELVFTNKNDYQDYISNNSITEVVLYNPKILYNSFSRTEKLPWKIQSREN